MTGIFAINISDTDINIEDLKKYMSAKRIGKIIRLNNEKQKKLSAAAEMALIDAVKDRYHNVKLPLAWDTDKYGKLYLCDYPKLFVNISHSGDYAVCVSSNTPVGVDLQYVRSTNMRIAERFFTEEECRFIRDDEKRFFDLWVRKESFVKAVGRGLSIGLNTFSVLEDIVDFEGKKYRFKPYKTHDQNYRLCICEEITGR